MKLKTKVIHSNSKPSWYVVGTTLGCKHRIAEFHYLVTKDEATNTQLKHEALEHARFTSNCFNEVEWYGS